MRKYKLLLIRHGATKGNIEHRYVGSTDEGLTGESVKSINNIRERILGIIKGKDCDINKKIEQRCKLFVSPMKRCIETAELLFPKLNYQVVDGLRECDFGQFEYMNYTELEGNADYQRFIDTMGECGFPDGETKKEFITRVVSAFFDILRQTSIDNNIDTIIIVSHGGTIMSIMDTFSSPHRDYYEWQVGCGDGYVAGLCIEKEIDKFKEDNEYNRIAEMFDDLLCVRDESSKIKIYDYMKLSEREIK